MKKKLLIFPLGGNGLEALDCLGDEFELLGFIDDDAQKQGVHPLGFKVYGREVIQRFPESYVLLVQGGPDNFRQRPQVLDSFEIPTERFATVIHPQACVSPLAQVGYNCVIMAGVVLTFNAKLGNHVCVLPNSVIHHDTQIGDYTLIGSQVVVAGHTIIGANSYIGSNSSIINNITVGDQVLVGLGSNVIRSISSGMKIAGNPAKPLGNSKG